VSARGAGAGTARASHRDPAAPVSWRSALERVLDDPATGLDLAFQPVIDLQRGVVVGYEALARLAGPPSAPPDRWFAAAAGEGLAARLEAAVLERALPTRSALPPDCFLSVNLNPNMVLDRTVRAVLDEAGELPGVVLELTEHDRIHDYSALRRALTRLRASGVNVAMDDAGAGYAGLASLLALRPDLVKIDRTLISGIDVDPVKRELVELLGTMAGRMDAWVLAEGIERREELDTLVRLGVPLGQGFLLGRPAPDRGDIEPGVATHIRQLRTEGGEGDTVAALVEDASAVALGATGEATARFEADSTLEVIPVVDRWERPVALHRRADALAGEGPIAEFLRVQAVESVAGVARRAMGRPRTARLDPLLCCDGMGRLRGVVRVDRLLEALAH
jgi:EAL domain-containing protein (putative c-di-GMP-specific phosphodiesterase class I)